MEEQRKSTQKLFSELTAKLIIPLDADEIVCPTCKGLRFVYKQKNEKEGYIENCRNCYNGKLYVCKYCGKANKTEHCDCKESQEERDMQYNKEQQEKERKLFDKAKKVKFTNYKGFFMISDGNPVQDSDAVYDWLYDKIKYEKTSDEELPTYLWATQSEPVFSLDLKDTIYDKCENGYEDMDSYLNTDDEDLKKAQKYLDKWYEKQGDNMNIYYEDYNVAVLLDDLIKKIRKNLKKEGENNKQTY